MNKYAYVCTENSYHVLHQKRELNHNDFQTVYGNDEINNKPLGGIWLSRVSKQKLNNKDIFTTEWLEYIGSSSKPLAGFYGFIINLKEDSQILNIQTIEELKKIYKLYPSINKPYQLDYQTISNYYDGIVINPYIDSSLSKWGVTSMVLFNLDVIESYQPFEIKCVNHCDGYNDFYHNYFEHIEEPKYLKCKTKKIERND